MTKLIIAGSRTLDIDLHMLGGILLQLGFDDWNKLEIVHGGAKGSLNMLETMKKLKKPVYEIILKCHN